MTVSMALQMKSYRWLHTLIVYDYNDGKRYIFTNHPKSFPHTERRQLRSIKCFEQLFGDRFVRQIIRYQSVGYGLVILERIPFGYL